MEIKMKKIDIRYIAGFFEGEGSICKYITYKYKPQLRWQTTHRQSYQVLKKLIPYMVHKEKIKKAKEVFKFYE